MNQATFAICINPNDCEDLTHLKVYQILPDESAARDNYIRVIDDSGEDYLYPASYFISLELPEIVQQVFSAVK
jgi:hypothetical protein